MKKFLITFVLALLAISVAWSQEPQAQPGETGQPAQTQPAPAEPGQATQPGQAAQPSTPAQPGQSTQPGQTAQPGATPQAAQPPAVPENHPVKPAPVVKDAAEYNSYTAATQMPDVNMKISGLTSFIQRYPNSALKENALEELMRAYQQANNIAKAADTARQLLQANPNNLAAMATLAFLDRSAAESGQNPQQNAAEALQLGEKGLQVLPTAPRPENVSEAEFEKFLNRVKPILAGAAGFGALQAKDYATAQKYLQEAVNLEPPTAESLRDIYPLAVSYLEANPPNPIGLWYAARAVVLSNNNAQVSQYAVYKYAKYHGNQDGWQQLLAEAQQAQSNTPPPGFTVAPAPSPQDIARNLANSKPPEQMNLGEIETVLQYGDPASQQKVWSAIQGKTIKFPAVVLSATRTELQLGATEDAISSKKPDVVITMETPMPAKDVPKVGSQVELQAAPVSYDPAPNFLIHMKPAMATPARKPAPRRRTRGR